MLRSATEIVARELADLEAEVARDMDPTRRRLARIEADLLLLWVEAGRGRCLLLWAAWLVLLWGRRRRQMP